MTLQRLTTASQAPGARIDLCLSVTKTIDEWQLWIQLSETIVVLETPQALEAC
jgi:hypothetical protein